MTMTAGPSYLTFHIAMKHPVLAAGAACSFLAVGAYNPESGYVLFTFDDGNMSDYIIAYPALTDAGKVATFYTTDSNIGKEGYMGHQHINLLQGWERGYHTISHPDLTKLDPNLLDSEVGTSTEDFKSFASPFGYYGERELKEIEESGYLNHVNAWSDANGKNPLATVWQDRFNLDRITISSKMTAEDVCAMAPTKDEALIMAFHSIVPDDQVDVENAPWTIGETMFYDIIDCFEGYNNTTVSGLVEQSKK